MTSFAFTSPSLSLVPLFLSPEECRLHLSQLVEHRGSPWNEVSGRKVRQFGGIPHEKGMVAAPLGPCSALARILAERAEWVFGPGRQVNHGLLNEYEPGKGIMPHTDGPLYENTVAIISLEGDCVFEFLPRIKDLFQERDEAATTPVKSVYVPSGSLLVFSAELYDDHLHRIPDEQVSVTRADCVNASPGMTVERGKRTSLTLRIVKKVLKTKIML
jgi:alkylated DNA repair protein alkB family protein 6